MEIWGDFQGLTGVTRGGRGVKKLGNWGDVIYGWSLFSSDSSKMSGYVASRSAAPRCPEKWWKYRKLPEASSEIVWLVNGPFET